MGPYFSVIADAAFLAGAVLMVYGAATAPYAEGSTKSRSFVLRTWFSSWTRNPLGRLRTQRGADSETRCVTKIALKAGLSEKTSRRAMVILKSAEERGISASKDPMGLAAAVLYAACILEGEDKTQKDLAEAAGITEVTIRNRYKGLRDAVGI